ncbi:50S ribosomal protein L11 [Candidatus Woesearchaeota archaeon]|nr:50S ribosomal protein L11 [Candidatus Woesearchaeota archaeon]
MASQTVEALVEGGKATAAPPLGPALGPLKVNIGQVVAEINKKTADFKGMQVPVKVTVDTEDKSFTISIGTPPASSLVKKEAGVQKGSGNPQADLVADLKIQQIIKIANMKGDSLLGADRVAKVKEIIGTCQSMGVMVEGAPAHEAIERINKGELVDLIKAGKTELSSEELKALEEEKKRLAATLEQKRKQYETIAKQVSEKFKNATRSQLKTRLIDAGIPAAYVDQFLPAEEKKK